MAQPETHVEPSPAPTKPKKLNDNGIHLSQSTTIDRPAADLFRFWRNFENLPHFMSHLESVSCANTGISHWKAKAPLGQKFEWDAEIISEQPDKLIAWKTLQDSDFENAGTVRFKDTDRGTEVHVIMDYIPPAGKFGNAIAKLLGESPSGSLREDLRRLKQLMETGEIATNEGPRGTCSHNKTATRNGGHQ